MLKPIVNCCIIICMALLANAQHTTAVRYRDQVFPSLVYSKEYCLSAAHYQWKKWTVLQLDLYQPLCDTIPCVPSNSIIWIHGGGFKFGTKRSASTPLWSKTFCTAWCIVCRCELPFEQNIRWQDFLICWRLFHDAVEDVQQAVAFLNSIVSNIALIPTALCWQVTLLVPWWLFPIGIQRLLWSQRTWQNYLIHLQPVQRCKCCRC